MSQKQLKKQRKLNKKKEEKRLKPKILPSIWQIIKKNWLFLLLVLLGTVLLYLNSLHGDFVSDDYATIPNNPLIMDFQHGLKGWMGGLINWSIASIFGIESPIPFHIFSLFLYLLIIVFLFVFLSLLFKKRVAYLATTIFAVLPIHVEAVSWIAGRPYLLNALFIILSLIFLVYFLQTEKKKYFWIFLGSAFLTFAAEKTRSTALPLLGFLYWVSFDHQFKKKISVGKILLAFGLLFMVTVIVLWPQMINRIQTVNSGVNVSDSVFYNPFFQYPVSMTKYLQLLWMPVDLTLYHTMYDIPTWINWLTLLSYLFSVVYFYFRNKKVFFALAFIFLAAAPSMAPVKISWLVAERYMFLGSVGFTILLAFILDKIWKINKFLPISLLTVIVCIYGFRVFMRNKDWRTNHDLWVNTCQVSPNSHNAWNNIGDDYDKLGDYDNSIKGFRQSTLIKTNYADAYHNMANILFKINRLDLAKATYEKGLSYNPNLYQSYFNLIQIDLRIGDYNSALANVEKLKKLQPNNLQVWYVDAVVNNLAGRKDYAIEVLKMLLTQNPDFQAAADLLSDLTR